MAERDELQAARWDAIRRQIGSGLRGMRGEGRSQAQLALELDEMGFHVSQSMVSRYEQGQGEVPLSLERIVGWALCCEVLSSEHLREILESQFEAPSEPFNLGKAIPVARDLGLAADAADAIAAAAGAARGKAA